MKKVLRLIALSLVLVMGLVMFASCAKTLSGTYENMDVTKSGTVLTFEGDKVTFSMKALGSEVASFDATYEIKDDTIAFDFDDEDVDNDWVKEAIEELEKPVSFEEGEDYIKIGGEKFTKKADK